MNIRNFLKKCLMEFYIITTCITIAYAIIGKAIYPDVKFGFEAFFSPIILGVLSSIPSVITYSKKELNFHQTITRKVMHLTAIEAILIVFGYIILGQLRGKGELLVCLLLILIIYIAVNLFSWWLDQKDADKINEALKSLQQRK